MGDETKNTAGQMLKEEFGMNNYHNDNGFTQSKIYQLAGRNDYTSSILLRQGSEAAMKYGISLTICFIYTLKERKRLEEDNDALNNETNIKAIELCGSLNDGLSKELKETGISTKDIVELTVLPITKYCNTFPSEDTREIKILNVPMSPLDRGEDIKWMYGFLKHLIEDNVAITPEEYDQYLAYKLIIEADKLTKAERSIIYNEKNQIKPTIVLHILSWKNEEKGLSDYENKLLNGIILKRMKERVRTTEYELKKNGTNFKKLAEKYPEKFKLLMEKVQQFHEIRYNTTGKHLLYCSFTSFLHIYLRHVKEFQILNQFKDRDKFQLEEEDVMPIMEIVMCNLNNEYQEYKEKNPNGRFHRVGEMAYYLNGDYYDVDVNQDGSISTFYKRSGAKTDK